jgi:hypothetical protein
MAKKTRRLTVAIPTFRRAGLLGRVLGELERQTRRPDRLIVVDGEGGALSVRQTLERSGWPELAETLLVPSARANLPFQRWLARRLAADSDALVFFDDDLLLPQACTVAKLAAALDGASAATCAIRMPRGCERFRLPLNRLAWLRRRRAGTLSAGGARYPPADDGREFAPVEWLRGGAMAFRCEALPPEAFPTALFALAEVGAGMGEELALARCVRGPIVLVRGLEVEHPSKEPSRVAPAHAAGQGFATAYSRRLLNDLCRGGSPGCSDRAALALSWAGGLAAASLDYATRGDADRGAFARGYLRGVLEGVFHPPSHGGLTPGIDWEAEAQMSLAAVVDIAKEASCQAIRG